MSRAAIILTLVVQMLCQPLRAAELPGFRPSAWFGEQVREEWVSEGVRVHVSAAGTFDPKQPTRLVIFATPNGNSIEQTLGCGPAAGLDWHYDIQHVAAQVRRLRELSPGENVVLACTEAEGLSWPAWRRRFPDSPARVRQVVATVRGWLPGERVRLALTGHSGGGSFLFNYLNGGPDIPADVDNISFLDANYNYTDADQHGDKLLTWLNGDPARRLTSIAYDDRNITVNGKLVVGPDGGTFRATERMRARFAKDVTFAEEKAGDFVNRRALDGRLTLLVHTNPANKILHTPLVGEMNGLLHALADPKLKWGTFGGPRAYAKWVQPAPGIPPRRADALGGSAVFRTLDKLPLAEREERLAAELLRGNLPGFLRKSVPVTIGTKPHTVTLDVMPDYLAVGSDDDFVRVPLTPQTAVRIADAFGYALPTRKLVDEIYRAAHVKLEPRPLTQDREAAATFLQHNALIEKQRGPKPNGELTAGHKKDIVVSNRILERPNRLALYGWHKLDGTPIQPLTIVHWDRYVDYSHGVRFLKRTALVDGKPRDLRHALYAGDAVGLLSDEGAIRRPGY